MMHTRFVRVLLLVVICTLLSGCGGNIFVPLPSVQPAAAGLSTAGAGADAAVAAAGMIPAQAPAAVELLGAVVTSSASGAPDFAPLAAASEAVIDAHPTPDFGRMAELANSTPPGVQLLSGRQRSRVSTLYQTLQGGSTGIFVLDTARCSFDSAQGFLHYQDGTYTQLSTRDVQINIRGQLQEMYFRVRNGGLSVDVSPGGGPAQFQLRSDGAVALGWQAQTDIGTEQVVGLVSDDQMALTYDANLSTVIYGTRAGRSDSGRLTCPMSWLAQADWPPLPPTNVQIQSTAARCLVVTWQANTSMGTPAKYVVVRQLSSESRWGEVATVTTTYYQDCSQAAITESSTAFYQVVAVSRNNRRSSASEMRYIQLIDRALPSWGG